MSCKKDNPALFHTEFMDNLPGGGAIMNALVQWKII
ncbi:hypothetical protein FHX37_4536 [Haloactinospora alba]|uniref:Uncharacterized protein n=1 Tax=Haloactinospora alba TaxID=405555 RepID=A0A543N7K0_9ACTN|nr:hypothetical protein FHX37_4536 [Haloactinospora alba]